VSLVYVAYAYSGWNAAAYLAGEIKNPKRSLPASLVGGTLIVMFLYFLLNYIFLYTIPLDTLAAEQAKDFSKPVEVGYFSADYIFGLGGANTMALIIAILLVSTISAMIIAGPRVLAAMGHDVKLLKYFSHTTSSGIPARAVIGQSIVSIILILTASFDELLVYVGFTLQLFTNGIGCVHYKIQKIKRSRRLLPHFWLSYYSYYIFSFERLEFVLYRPRQTYRIIIWFSYFRVRHFGVYDAKS
jgi:APA family basic amino acid/polyamine antiporter